MTLEAMACGLPVVAASATGTTNLVSDGQTGALVEPGDAEAYADALEAYARDPALARTAWSSGPGLRRDPRLGPYQFGRAETYQRVIDKRRRYARLTRR